MGTSDGALLRTRETVLCETPASFATSRMVTAEERCIDFLLRINKSITIYMQSYAVNRIEAWFAGNVKQGHHSFGPPQTRRGEPGRLRHPESSRRLLFGGRSPP